jgi:hypothetical protein
MVSRGARHLILLSRSGSNTTAAQDLVAELKSQGVSVATPRVDISDLSALQQILSGLAKAMPPIRGCIQATVALRVRLLGILSRPITHPYLSLARADVNLTGQPLSQNELH